MEPGQTIFQRYTLIRKLGQGGMGVVWLARDEKLEREVALKFLAEALMHDPDALRDLKRETRRCLDLTHPNIVRVHDFVEDGAQAAISMEYVLGASLAAVKARQPLGCFEIGGLGRWVKQIGETLEHAHHRARVIHRDLKPANLMLTPAGDIKIMDFGIARSLADSASRLTRSTSGTLSHMSPQQALGEPPSPADDLYALGATLYELLTSRPPFFSGDIATQLLHKTPPSLAERRRELGIAGADIPPAWEQAVARCLAKNPAERPAGGQALLDLLPASDLTLSLSAAELLEAVGEPEIPAAGVVPDVISVQESQALQVTTDPQPLLWTFAGLHESVDLVLAGSWQVQAPALFLEKSMPLVAAITPMTAALADACLVQSLEHEVREALRDGLIEPPKPDGPPGRLSSERWQTARLIPRLGERGVTAHLEAAWWEPAQAALAGLARQQREHLKIIAEATKQCCQTKEESLRLAESMREKPPGAPGAAASGGSARQRIIERENQFQQRRFALEMDLLEGRRQLCRTLASQELAAAELRLKAAAGWQPGGADCVRRVLERDRQTLGQSRNRRQQSERNFQADARRLSALKLTYEKLAAQYPGLLLALLGQEPARVYDAGGWLEAVDISAEALAELGYPTPQLFTEFLRKKAATDGLPVRVRKLDLQTRSLPMEGTATAQGTDTIQVGVLTVHASLQFEFTSQKPGYVTVINPGTSGRFWLQAPNVFAPAPAVAPNQGCQVPGPELLPWEELKETGLDYREQGPPGWEYLAVLISAEPLVEAATVARSQPRQPFVLLTRAEVQALQNRLKSLPPEAWTAGLLSFRVAGLPGS